MAGHSLGTHPPSRRWINGAREGVPEGSPAVWGGKSEEHCPHRTNHHTQGRYMASEITT